MSKKASQLRHNCIIDWYTQCVSNALQSEAQTLLKHQMRQISTTEQAEPLGLSDTILEALDLTMQDDIYCSVPLSQVIDNDDSDDGSNLVAPSSKSTIKTHQCCEYVQLILNQREVKHDPM